MSLSSKRLFLAVASVLFISACVVQSWVVERESSDNNRAEMFQVKEDANGNVVVVGNTITQNRDLKAFVSKYDAAGSLVWNYEAEDYRVFAEGDLSSDFISVSDAGEVYVNLSRNGESAAMKLVKLSSEGALEWEAPFIGSIVASVHATSAGNVIVSLLSDSSAVFALSSAGESLWGYSAPTNVGVGEELVGTDEPATTENASISPRSSVSKSLGAYFLDFGVNRIVSTDSRIFVAYEGIVLSLNHEGELLESKSASDLGVESILDISVDEETLVAIASDESEAKYVFLDHDLAEVYRHSVDLNSLGADLSALGRESRYALSKLSLLEDGSGCYAVTLGDKLQVGVFDESGEQWQFIRQVDTDFFFFLNASALGSECLVSTSTYRADEFISFDTKKFDEYGSSETVISIEDTQPLSMTVSSNRAYIAGLVGMDEELGISGVLHKEIIR